jgi:hypothetical protein
MLGQSHGVVKASISERPRAISAVCMEIKIASDHECRLIDVRGAVRKNLIQLLDTQRVVTFALQVKVVGDDLPAVNSCFRYESDPPADPALKNSHLWDVPMRLPERGLVPETNDPSF